MEFESIIILLKEKVIKSEKLIDELYTLLQKLHPIVLEEFELTEQSKTISITEILRNEINKQYFNNLKLEEILDKLKQII